MEEAFIEKNCIHRLTKFFFLLVITYNMSYYTILDLFIPKVLYVKKLACNFFCKSLCHSMFDVLQCNV